MESLLIGLVLVSLVGHSLVLYGLWRAWKQTSIPAKPTVKELLAQTAEPESEGQWMVSDAEQAMVEKQLQQESLKRVTQWRR